MTQQTSGATPDADPASAPSATSTPTEPDGVEQDGGPRRGGHPSFVWCFLGFLVANVFSGHTQDLPVSLPIGPDRLLFAAAAVLFLLDRRSSLRDLRLGSVHAVAVAVVTVAALSALAVGTLTTSLGFFALLDRLAVPYLVFTIAPVLFARAEDRVLLLKVLTLVGIYLSVTAVGEMLGPRSLVFPRYILDPEVGIQYGRARGPFTASEANGMTMVAALWCAFVLARLRVGMRWRRLAQLTVMLTAVGALLTLTRSVWLGLVLGVVLVAATDRASRRVLVVVVLLTTMLGALALLGSAEVRERAFGRAGDAGSVYDRRNTNAAAIRAIEQNPVTGIGWVRFIDVSGRYVRQSPTYPVTVTDIEVHNVVLSRTAELGIPGGALWVLSVVLGPVVALWRGLRTTDAAARTWTVVLLGTFSCWIVPVMSSPVSYPLPNTLLWLFAGIATAALSRAATPSPAATATPDAGAPNAGMRPGGRPRRGSRR